MTTYQPTQKLKDLFSGVVSINTNSFKDYLWINIEGKDLEMNLSTALSLWLITELKT